MRPRGVIETARLLVECVQCGDIFAARRSTAQYCSKPCQAMAHRIKRGTRICEHCATEFHPCEATTRFCSPSCRSRGMGLIVGAKNSKTLLGRGKLWYQDGRSKRWVVVGRNKRNYLWYRVVMENALGRPLLSDETVHHINGDCTDDRPDNLAVMSRSDHGRLHALQRAGR